MKALNKFLFCTALLAGATGFYSCSNDDIVDQGTVNPTFDGESVKTQFAINIPAGKNTRMSSENTQQQKGAFLGMQGIKLIPLTTNAVDGTSFTQVISLPNIADSDLDDQKKIYSDVNVPVKTSNFLFYGEALGSADVQTTDAFAKGVLQNNLSDLGTVSTTNIKFNLLPVTTNKKYSAGAQSRTDVLTAVNNVSASAGWKDYAENPDNSQKPLTKLYESFTGLKAGSAESVKLTLADLKVAIQNLLTAGGSEQSIAEAINTQIEAAIGADGKGGTLASNTYPTDYNLPVGAAQLSWENGVASYDSDVIVKGVALDPAKVCYPAALSYFVSTGLKASDSSNPVWPTFDEWKAGTWSGWTDGPVAATTQAIALTSPINYGVAVLESAVQCKTQSLEDNAIEAGELQNRRVTVPTDGFPVTGILIGGQPDALKWNFKPASDNDRTMTVYDNAVNTVAKYNDKSSVNYTLVLENTKAGDADKVNVAIEMTNNSGGDFYGKDGIVKAGATFYLIGQLDLDNLGANGNNESGRTSVFEQDYKTIATFTISSLKSAYNCIPDLRASQLSLGLAVDLEWKKGVTFDVTIE